MGANARPWCAAPWYALHLMHDHFAPCCYIAFQRPPPLGNGAPDALRGLFNGPEMRELRRALAAREVSGTPCAYCHVRESGVGHADEPGATHAAAAQRAQQAFADGQVDLDYPPYHLALGTSSRCNLRCTMCYTTSDSGMAHEHPGISMPALFSLLETSGWDKLALLGMSGGEPLLTGEFQYALEAFARLGVDSVLLDVTTNATLLHRHMERLEQSPLRRLRFTVSVDGCGEAYEAVRLGASWPILLQNLENLSQLKAKRPGWEVEIHSLVMRSTLEHLSCVVDLAARLGFRLVFNAIVGASLLAENIFAFPELLEESDWRQHLDKAISRAQETGLHRAAADLRKHKAMLEDRHAGACACVSTASTNSIAGWGDYLERTVGSAPVAVAGLSEELFGFLQANRRYNVKAVADFALPPQAVRQFAGVPLLPLEQLNDVPCGDIIINARTFNVLERMETAKRLFANRRLHLFNLFDPSVHQRVADLAILLGNAPVALFGAGGLARILLEQTRLKDMNLVAVADNNAARHGSLWCGLPIIPPQEIGARASDVIILSQAFQGQMLLELATHYGDALRAHTLF